MHRSSQIGRSFDLNQTFGQYRPVDDRGSIEPETGIVIDLGLLDEILRREVIDRFQMPNGVEVYCVGVREDRDLRSDAYAGAYALLIR